MDQTEVKLDGCIKLPEHLDLHSFLTPDSPAATNQGARYRLGGLAEHLGDDFASGHYRAYVADGGEHSC